MNKQEGKRKTGVSKYVSWKGILLLICGVCLLWYSVVAIQQRENVLNSADLSLSEMWNYEGSMAWWTNACVTLFLPLTSVLTAVTLEPVTSRIYKASALVSMASNA